MFTENFLQLYGIYVILLCSITSDLYVCLTTLILTLKAWEFLKIITIIHCFIHFLITARLCTSNRWFLRLTILHNTYRQTQIISSVFKYSRYPDMKFWVVDSCRLVKPERFFHWKKLEVIKYHKPSILLASFLTCRGNNRYWIVEYLGNLNVFF